MVIREEYPYSKLQDYLKREITAVIVGIDRTEDRCQFIYNEFTGRVSIIAFGYDHACKKFIIEHLNQTPIQRASVSQSGIAGILSKYLQGGQKNILIDLTSLQHAAIISLLDLLLNKVKPAHLFATYVKPEAYLTRNDMGKYSFSKQIYEPAGIPNLVRQQKEKEIVIPFLGFEGERFQNIIQDMTFEKVLPVIGFPSEDPAWQFEALRNCRQAIESTFPDAEIKKCKSNSIFDAIDVLNKIEECYPDNNFVLLPLGIRPHTAGCAIWAAPKKKARIIYDYATEVPNRAEGVSEIVAYHLSSFIT